MAAFLAIADDGRQYWVKAPNNPSGTRGLIAERVVYGLGEILGAPVPESVLMEIPPSMPWEVVPGIRLRAGIAHGSLNIEPVVVHEDWGTYASHDHNRDRQAVIVALWDLCLGEDAQWLHHLDDDMSIWTFDHGLWFGGGADWTVNDLERVGTQPWAGLDAGVASKSSLLAVADRLDALDLDTFRAVTAQVPVGWDTSAEEMSELASILFVRAESVVARLRTAAIYSRHP
jgi:hypothetical protein